MKSTFAELLQRPQAQFDRREQTMALPIIGRALEAWIRKEYP